MLYKGWFSFGKQFLVSFPKEHLELDPFQELADSELVQVNSFLLNASFGSGTDAPSAGEALKADSTLQMCAKMTANWEEELFSSLSVASFQNWPDNDSDEGITEVNVVSKEPKVKSLKEATAILEDVTEYLTSENLTEMANDLSKVLSNIQSTWLGRKLKASVQSEVTDFFKWIYCCACFNNNTILKRFYSETMINSWGYF